MIKILAWKDRIIIKIPRQSIELMISFSGIFTTGLPMLLDF
jgi:hypothetical protein